MNGWKLKFGVSVAMLLIVWMCMPGLSSADMGVPSQDTDTSLLHFPVKLFDDLPHLFVPENIVPFAIGGLATGLDWVLLDQQNSLASGLNRLNIESVFNFGEFYGEGWVEGIGGLSSWGFGALVNDKKLQLFGRDTIEALVTDTIAGTGIKFAVNRTRPNGGAYSFPSGHTGVAFCVAPVVQRYWGWEAGVPAYVLATITGCERVADHWHYLSDVLAAATIGIVIGNAVIYEPKNISLTAIPGGVEAKWVFD